MSGAGRYRVVYAPAAVDDLSALGKDRAAEVVEQIDAALSVEPYGGTSMERPLGGGPWDRVALLGMVPVRYTVSDAPGIDPPTVTVVRVLI